MSIQAGKPDYVMWKVLPSSNATRVLLLLFAAAVLLFTYNFLNRGATTKTKSENTDTGTNSWSVHEFEDRQAEDKPHIVFILADDYGFNDVGYRNPFMKTPNMDALAGAGVKLDSYYVQPICTPSRAQLMSGRYQVQTSTHDSILLVCFNA